ncbi:MAG: hypothetical protein JWR39_390 [Devosia sp.]|jgi:hypothetical protein|nr:hypothetical protein [Devosia sp.]
MANAIHTALSRIEDLSGQLAGLRGEVARLVRPARRSGVHALHGAQHQAVVLAKDFKQHGEVAAHRLGHQARLAGKSIGNDPVPLLVALGTFVLLSSLFLRRR